MVSLRTQSLAATLVFLIAISANAQALQDPTRPNGFQAPQVEAKPERSFSLTSIILGPARKVAVIDGQARREGQTFEGVRLRRIHPDRVELIDQGRVRILRLETLPQVRSSQ